MRGVILEKLINNHCSEDVSVNKLGVLIRSLSFVNYLLNFILTELRMKSM